LKVMKFDSKDYEGRLDKHCELISLFQNKKNLVHPVTPVNWN